ncbi:DUF2231 domain-containing protein [Nocardioides panacisoli]|uniref:DUF2231 domain-containing protein n=1 Tax=Nocardioides panacisoli TaxID=627624 RepID=A0ABP7ISN3_9ACTN
MFDTFNGLPVHPLVVHAVVVLLPLAIAGTLAISFVPRWRLRYGPLVVAAAFFATVLIPVATSSGESLEEKVGDPGEHAELGDQLIWFAVPLLLFVAALVWLEWRASKRPERSTEAPARSRGLLKAVVALSVVASLAAGVQVFRVGDSGARAAWGDSSSQADR